MTAKLFGRIHFDNTQTILYRQHQGNVLGAKSSGMMRFIRLGLNGQGISGDAANLLI
ncbi:hypothetical protein U0A22_21095 [Escherichia coli]|nr:hypothetical protein [Escherichia coli]